MLRRFFSLHGYCCNSNNNSRVVQVLATTRHIFNTSYPSNNKNKKVTDNGRPHVSLIKTSISPQISASSFSKSNLSYSSTSAARKRVRQTAKLSIKKKTLKKNNTNKNKKKKIISKKKIVKRSRPQKKKNKAPQNNKANKNKNKKNDKNKEKVMKGRPHAHAVQKKKYNKRVAAIAKLWRMQKKKTA